MRANAYRGCNALLRVTMTDIHVFHCAVMLRAIVVLVQMISAEAPVLFAKACELFILDLTMRAWGITDASGRRTLQR